MYIIVNQTTGKTSNVKGSWPERLILDMLINGDNVIVISMYSSTIKTCRLGRDWNEQPFIIATDFPLPTKAIVASFVEKNLSPSVGVVEVSSLQEWAEQECPE